MSMKREEFEAKIYAKAASDPAFLSALRANPKAALQKELTELKADVTLPDNLQVTLVEESPQQIYLRLPVLPGQLSEADLAGVSGGTSTGLPPTSAVMLDVATAVQIGVVVAVAGPGGPGGPVVIV